MFKSYPLLSRFLLFVALPVAAALITCFVYLRGSLPPADGRVIKAGVSQPVELTRVEFDFLAALAARPGTAIPRQWLVDHVLDPDRDGNERTLDVHASRLRKKLGRGSFVETVWGIGYRLATNAGA